MNSCGHPVSKFRHDEPGKMNNINFILDSPVKPGNDEERAKPGNDEERAKPVDTAFFVIPEPGSGTQNLFRVIPDKSVLYRIPESGIQLPHRHSGQWSEAERDPESRKK